MEPDKLQRHTIHHFKGNLVRINLSKCCKALRPTVLALHAPMLGNFFFTHPLVYVHCFKRRHTDWAWPKLICTQLPICHDKLSCDIEVSWKKSNLPACNKKNKWIIVNCIVILIPCFKKCKYFLGLRGWIKINWTGQKLGY